MVRHNVEHYYSEKQHSVLTEKTLDVTLFGARLSFVTPSGVFSFGHIDKGSLLLVEAVVLENQRVLDFGCGWGFVGVIVKKRFSGCAVTLTDVNERALHYAATNARKNHVSVHVVKSNLFSGLHEFDAILVNPPMHAGREICYSLIEQAKQHLSVGGKLYLVALHNKGGAMLEKKMNDVFGNVQTAAKKGGFRVYVATNQ
ncbi:class I SAM-dependent methyltransferase [Candidatus Woesearchaeota archaeon]|nr:class I SAM-dependent methyltransferase [Candidatus Woesearchaeota archaeon]